MAHVPTQARPVGADAGGDAVADPTRVSRRHCRVRTQAATRMHVQHTVAAEACKERAEAEKRKREAVAEAAAAGDEEGSSGRKKKKQRVGAQSVTNGKKWTVEEDAWLLEQCKKGVPPSKIVIPNRTACSIQRRLLTLRKQAAALGDNLSEDIAAALAKRCVKWTAEEDASLLEQRKKGVPPSKIIIPNRTSRSIQKRLHDLRKQAAALGDNLDDDIAAALAKRRVVVRGTVEEDAWLLEQCKNGVPVSQIVIPNRTSRSIHRRLQTLRKQAAASYHKLDDSIAAALAKRREQTRWATQEDASLLVQFKRGVPVSKIVIPSRTASAIRSRLHSLRKQAAALGDKLDGSIVAALAKKREHVRWTAEEDASLVEQCKKCVPTSKIVISNRTAFAIRYRLHSLRKQAAAIGDKLDGNIVARTARAVRQRFHRVHQ